jgi:ADP-ribosylglycohydrolase
LGGWWRPAGSRTTLAGAAAVAAAVSAGVAGAGIPEAIQAAVTAAGRAAGRGYWVAAADVAARITWATGLTAGRPADEVLDAVYTLVGTSLATQESVPAAFAMLAAVPDDPWLACRLAASAGGDCDTIAAITGAIGGACHGVSAFPEQARTTVCAVNGLHLDEVAARLLVVRGPWSAGEWSAGEWSAGERSASERPSSERPSST